MNTATATVSDICHMFETTSTRRSIQAAIDAEIIASDPSVVYFTRT